MILHMTWARQWFLETGHLDMLKTKKI